jgi:cyclophilin family peptidyl-prolyl cis-trans isomerase
MRRYVTGELPQQVFVDQCFTLQHNNGSLFDKFFDTDDVLTVLDAQASGHFETLAAHASPEVRRRWQRHQRRLHAGHESDWLALPTESSGEADMEINDEPGWAGLSVWEALPGALGCGSSQEAARFAAEQEADQVDKVRLRRPIVRRPPPGTPERYEGASATLDTSLGPVELTLWPRLAPYTVDNFVSLARGTRRAAGGEPYEGGYYDGTEFHRRIPGFLVQGGDRTGTGEGGPGYRIRDELNPELTFDVPFRLAMANTGRDSTGSQFFITLAPSGHLTGAFTQFGAVEDPTSQEVLLAIADSAEPVLLRSVRVRTW